VFYLLIIFMITEKEGEEGEGDTIPDDTQINQMLARTDEEFTVFEEMDRERIQQEKEEARRSGRSKPRPRFVEKILRNQIS
jgi:hypothetical protein